MRNPMKRIFTWGKKRIVEGDAKTASALKGVAEETLAIAREPLYRSVRTVPSAPDPQEGGGGCRPENDKGLRQWEDL